VKIPEEHASLLVLILILSALEVDLHQLYFLFLANRHLLHGLLHQATPSGRLLELRSCEELALVQ
jgi:hypothetical protein